MDELTAYIHEQLESKLKAHQIVVIYDSRGEFSALLGKDDSESVVDPELMAMGQVQARIVRFRGSFFEVREAVAQLRSLEETVHCVVYLPGVLREQRGQVRVRREGRDSDPIPNVLLVFDQAGTSYEPSLKKMARIVLKRHFSDGQIDSILGADGVVYHDIVAHLEGVAVTGSPSILRTLYKESDGDELLAHWLSDDAMDGDVAAKGGVPELVSLIVSRLGFEMNEGSDLATIRSKTLRYVLGNDFRSDLLCDAPQSMALIPSPPTKQQAQRVASIADCMRQKYPDEYGPIADRVESELQLSVADISAEHLGGVDTFCFEERTLWTHVAGLITNKVYDEAHKLILERARSFWVDHNIDRQKEWEALRRMAELGLSIKRFAPKVAGMKGHPDKWVAAYVADEGWHRLDWQQRAMEAWTAQTDLDSPGQEAQATIRRDCEELLHRMAEGFTSALLSSGWSFESAMNQTHVFSEHINIARKGDVLLLVDALRYEMGVELATQVEGLGELQLGAAVASLPTITPIGMAALMPGAAEGFTVRNEDEKFIPAIGSTNLLALGDRQKHLASRIPEASDMPLGKVLNASPNTLKKVIAQSSLLVVRSQEIDKVGEMDGGMVARQAMESIIGNLSRAVRRLVSAGAERIVIAADHGYQFSVEKDESMRTDSPGGRTALIHRRCWAGYGGMTPAGCTRVNGSELGYETDLDFVFPTGLGVFKTPGGGLSYHHGGTSLQEMVIPVIRVRVAAVALKAPREQKVHLTKLPNRISNRTFGVEVSIQASLFMEATPVRIVLLDGARQVGKAGMAADAEIDREKSVVTVTPGQSASVGLMLTDEQCKSLRVVVQDPDTDVLLASSEEIAVELGI